MSDVTQYVTLGIAGETLAVPVDRVQEILEMQPISRLPHTPANFLGMIDVRDQGVPVFDLRQQLAFEAAEDCENTRIIVLQVMVSSRRMTFGLKADRVFEVTVLDSDMLDPAPAIGTPWRSECIAGIGRRNGAFVTVLHLERLFAADEIQLIVRQDTPQGKAA